MVPKAMGGESLQGKSRFIAFLDECGDHSMEKIDLDFPLFVLCTVILERERYVQDALPSLNQLKLRYWDHEGINLHSRDIRKALGPFSILKNTQTREAFLADLTALMERLPYTLFVVCINKERHGDRYTKPDNPYELALKYTFERVLHFLEGVGERHLPVIAESRGKNEDQSLEAAFYRLVTHGTAYIGHARFGRLSCPLLFENKKKNICGLQLADLCAHPSARRILIPDQANRAYDAVKGHIYERDGVKGWKVFP